MSATLTLDLTGFILPDGTALRDHVRKPARQSAHYLERYDRSTLYYDCVYQPDPGQYLFTAPRFLNLWPVLRDGLRLNGTPVRGLKRYNRGKYEQVSLRAPEGPLELGLQGTRHPLTTRQSCADRFAGLNCAVTMNKNNDPDWIRDWVRFHVQAHGLQGVVIYDNGSTAYGLRDIAAALQDLPGLEQVLIASAPYPYGTADSGKGLEIRPKFLQPALLNLARTDILRRARAVLNVDIDEMVTRRGTLSVFDATTQRRSGALKLSSEWAFPAPGTPMPAPQSRHLMRAVPPRRSNKKWCATPGGFFSRTGWFVHHVGGELFKLLRFDPEFAVVHCRCTSTSWKADGIRFALPETLRPDPELLVMMARYLGTVDAADPETTGGRDDA